MKKKLLEKINPLIFLFDTLIMVSIGVTSFVSVIMAMKYINEIYALTYISNIDLIKYVIKIIGFISLALITAVTMNIWYKENTLSVRRELEGTKLGWFVFILFFIIMFFIGWSLKIFIEVT